MKIKRNKFRKNKFIVRKYLIPYKMNSMIFLSFYKSFINHDNEVYSKFTIIDDWASGQYSTIGYNYALSNENWLLYYPKIK
jgi:hypothetical protein